MELMELIGSINGNDYDYNRALADPAAILEHDNLSNRTLFVGDVEQGMIDSIVKWILRWNMEDLGKPINDRKPIKLVIYSYGGDLRTALAIISTIKNSKTPINTYCIGTACSAGFLIFCSGKKRYALENSMFCVHAGAGSVGGTYDQVETASAQYKKDAEWMKQYILDNTNIPKVTLGKKWKTDWYFDTDQAIEFGVATNVVESLDDIVG